MSETSDRSVLDKARAALADGGPVRLARMAWDRACHPVLLWRDRTWLARRNAAITLARRAKGLPVVHVIGDSHTHVFRGVSPYVVTWLGAATAFNLGKAGSTTQSHEKLEQALEAVRADRDLVVLVLGEIDARIHVYNQHMKSGGTTSMESVMDATIQRYGAVVLDLAGRGYRVAVHSVPSAAHQENIYEFPFYADDETRSWIVREFNGRLSQWCTANGIEYLDLYSVVSDEHGFIRGDLTQDGTHLDERALPLYHEMIEHRMLQESTT